MEKELREEIEITLESAGVSLRNGNYENVIAILEPLVEKIEEACDYEDTKEKEYRSFFNPYEEIYYKNVYPVQAEVEVLEEPLAELYLTYGSALLEAEYYGEAQMNLEKAAQLNPVSPQITYALAEVAKTDGEWEEFHKLTMAGFMSSYIRPDVARGYRNMAYYYFEKEKYEAAAACTLLSKEYEPDSQNAEALTYHIFQKLGEEMPELDRKKYMMLADEYGFPLGPNPNLVKLALTFGQHFFQEGQMGIAQFFTAIAYDLTGDSDLQKLLMDLGAHTQKE